MDDDQQFCLRWNNHQSTLVSVFDNLLENGTLVDCTLFAEGKYLKAHKVVLSACSPYFEALLTQQYDKHPIFILKDVKFQELKAMMDYMYRGEVNISQDQLAALLKAAESLQIKGLSDSRSKESEPRKSAPPPVAKTPPPAPAPTLPRVQGLTIEQRKAPKLADTTIEDSRSREGSSSPVPRKRKKPRRRPSQEGVNDNHDASSSSESHSNQAPTTNIPSLPAVPLASTSKLTDVPEPVEAKSEIVTRQKAVDSPQVPIKEKLETHSELILEPKSEYIEEDMNEDSVEDLTLDDDDVSQMEQEMDHARPGPSHGSTDGSAQGFGGWHMSGNQNQDEVFLAAQEAVGAHRDSQDPLIKTEFCNIDEDKEWQLENLEEPEKQIPEIIPIPELVHLPREKRRTFEVSRFCDETIDTESDSEEDLELTPPAVKLTTLNSLPEVSRKKYEVAYRFFMDWQKGLNITSCSEKVLMAYFGKISKHYKATTLWTQYSMLRTTLNIHNNVDIAKYSTLRAFLKRQSQGYKPEKLKTFTTHEINKFLNEAPDKDYLLTKVAFIIGVMGGCRRYELHQMKTSDFNDLGSAVLVSIPDAKTKIVRKFTITGQFYELFKKYACLRPPNVKDSGFFINYQKGKCTIQKVGINKFGAMGKQIAKYLNLPNPELYTGHCFRKSTILVDGSEEVSYFK